jgi:hypothetical protein
MAIADEKFPWESYTEMVAFISMVAGLLVSFNVVHIALTETQVAGIASILFLVVMIARKRGNGGKVVLSKTQEPLKG